MTLNLSLVTSEYAICVTDRRLSQPLGGIVSERGNKLTMFECANARGFVTYNGIGRDLAGRSPNDWLADNAALPMLPFQNFVEVIKNIAEKRLAPLALKGYDTRHSFVIGGFVNGVPIMALVSNYESLVEDGWKDEANPELTVGIMSATPGTANGRLLLATGAFPDEKKPRFLEVANKVPKAANSKAMRAHMIKLLRDVSYGANRKASVGTSVMTAIVPSFGAVEVMLDVVGGTTLQEMPNVIAPRVSFRDAYIDTSGNSTFRYSRVHKKALIKERPCPQCGTPVPEGYTKCGVCDAAISYQF